MTVKSLGLKFVQRSASPRPLPRGEGDPPDAPVYSKFKQSIAIQDEFLRETSQRPKSFLCHESRVAFSLPGGRLGNRERNSAKPKARRAEPAGARESALG